MGIDGDTDASLIQAGTEQDWGPQGVLVLRVVRNAPGGVDRARRRPARRPGHGGDREDEPGTWSISVDDSTEGSLWTGSVAYSAPEASAEWIEEAPTDADTGNVEPLADYGSVQFSDMGVQGTGTRAATASPVYMVRQSPDNVVQSYPAPYDPSTDSFDLTYGSPARVPSNFPAVPIVTGTAQTTTTTSTTTPGPALPTTATTTPPGGHGYWLVGDDGGVFAFGDARFHGSTGNMVTKVRNLVVSLAVVTGIATTPDDGGYWLVTVNGGIFPSGTPLISGRCKISAFWTPRSGP